MNRRLPSSVPSVENDLIARLQQRLPETLVGWLPTSPPDPMRKPERIYLVGVQDLVRTVLAGQGVRREAFTLPLVIEVHLVTQDRDRPRDRWWELLEEIEAELAADDELGENGLSAGVGEIPEVNVVPEQSKGWIAKGIVMLRVESVI